MKQARHKVQVLFFRTSYSDIPFYNAPHHFSPGNIITDRASAKENDGIIPTVITRQIKDILCIPNLPFVMIFNVH
jgi:hypothetical protein